MTIAQVEPVFVTFSVPAAHLPTIKRHSSGRDKLTVVATPQDAEAQPVEGQLTFFDNVVDPTTDTIKLKATFANTTAGCGPASSRASACGSRRSKRHGRATAGRADRPGRPVRLRRQQGGGGRGGGRGRGRAQGQGAVDQAAAGWCTGGARAGSAGCGARSGGAGSVGRRAGSCAGPGGSGGRRCRDARHDRRAAARHRRPARQRRHRHPEGPEARRDRRHRRPAAARTGHARADQRCERQPAGRRARRTRRTRPRAGPGWRGRSRSGRRKADRAARVDSAARARRADRARAAGTANSRSASEHLRDLHPASHRHQPADGGDRAVRRRVVPRPAGGRSADRGLPDGQRQRRTCRAAIRRRWRRRSRARSSASSRPSPASTR